MHYGISAGFRAVGVIILKVLDLYPVKEKCSEGGCSMVQILQFACMQAVTRCTVCLEICCASCGLRFWLSEVAGRLLCAEAGCRSSAHRLQQLFQPISVTFLHHTLAHSDKNQISSFAPETAHGGQSTTTNQPCKGNVKPSGLF